MVEKEGDNVDLDEAVLEIATDKVDSEMPSPFAGKITKILFNEGDVVQIGKAIAMIETAGGSEVSVKAPIVTQEVKPEVVREAAVEQKVVSTGNAADRFYSPLVLNIAREEGISMAELESIGGTGKDDRVTKADILAYVKDREEGNVKAPVVAEKRRKICLWRKNLRR